VLGSWAVAKVLFHKVVGSQKLFLLCKVSWNRVIVGWTYWEGKRGGAWI
jgi:hypothetical protein